MAVLHSVKSQSNRYQEVPASLFASVLLELEH